MVGTEQSLPGRESLLHQRDRVGGPARRMVRGGEAVPRLQGIGMIRSQRPLKIRVVSGSPSAMAYGMLSPSSTR